MRSIARRWRAARGKAGRRLAARRGRPDRRDPRIRLPVRVGRLLLDELYPRWCVLCGAEPAGRGGERYLCEACVGRFPFIEAPICPRCGRPYGAAPEPPPACRGCLVPRSAGGLEWVRSACRSAGGVRETLHLLKYRNCRWLGPDLARIAAERLRAAVAAEGWDLLVPVPLHPRRQRERGFNQAEDLARCWGRAWGIALCSDALRRAKATLAQATLSSAARRRNMAGAFAVERPRDLRGRRVLLVDDVVTTGATLRELARVLAAAGDGGRPARIGAVTLGRGGL